jgi:NAD(P)-dependent dehydrogenase (short-subunit alcohol dehydrogenase family)
MESLEGSVALITGGGRGIGRAIAEAYLAAGARVTVTAARSLDEIDAVVRQAEPDRALGLLADVTDAAACEHAVAATVARFGQLDVLVNNAGRGMKYVSERFGSEPTRFWETDPAVWQLVIATNVNGPFFMARAAVPMLLRQGRGTIINISMNYATMTRRGFSPYGPSKAALESATIIWAQDLAGTGITVNELLPGGATDTGMVPVSVSRESRARLLRPELCGPPAVYLASSAARELTGRRLVATTWSREQPDGAPAVAGFGEDARSARGEVRGAQRAESE